MSRIKVTLLPQLNTLIFKQFDGHDFFISAPNVFIISITSLMFMVKFLIDNKYIDIQTLEGIVEEYHTDKGKQNG